MANPNRDAALQVTGLQVGYARHRQTEDVLRGLSFELGQGEILALLGESGSGKSTIAKAITGLLPPSARMKSGWMRIGTGAAQALNDPRLNWLPIRGRQLGMVFQDARLALNPVMTIREHFRESLLHHRIVPADRVDARAIELLRLLHFPEGGDLLDRYPHQLSGGMCQRICLALTLSLEPSVLIADEPTSALDTVSQREVLELLRLLRRELGLAVLLITHDIAVANAVSDRVIVLHKGTVVEEGPTRAVLAKPQAAYTRQLLRSRMQLAKPGQPAPHAPLPQARPVLEAIGLGKALGGRRVLRDVHLTLYGGEIVGILGQSGCGKSTLARCLTGLDAPDAGRIRIRGADLSRSAPADRRELPKRLQLVFQDARASLNPSRTAFELVQEPLRYLKVGGREERAGIAMQLLSEVSISGDARHRRPPQLSSGQCQRIAIARALVLRPDVLICDEAVSALDMRTQAQIISLLKRLHRQYGLAIVMISHDVRVLRSLCHRIAVMHDGTIGEIRRGSQLHESTEAHTQLLLKCAGELELGL